MILFYSVNSLGTVVHGSQQLVLCDENVYRNISAVTGLSIVISEVHFVGLVYVFVEQSFLFSHYKILSNSFVLFGRIFSWHQSSGIRL